MTVAAVYTTRNLGKRNGGTCYGPEWLWALKRSLNKHLPEHEFRYLSDVCPTPWREPLLHDWPGWWAKIELFRPGLFDGPVLYLDLDTLIVGDLSAIASYEGPFAILRDFYHPSRWQSAVMVWRPSEATERIYTRFCEAPPGYMHQFRSDQEFIMDTLDGATMLQDIYPGQIVSLKVHALDAAPEGARLVCAHGDPRLNDPEAGWAHERWLAA